MSLARRLLLRASRSSWLARQLAERAFLRRAVRRFLPGEDPGAALAAAASFATDGIGAVLTELGEQVTTAGAAQAVRDHYLELLDRIADGALGAHISVKLTHLGLEVDRAGCLHHLRTLATRAERAGSMVWIDMEESRYVDVTLELYRQVRAAHDQVGVCLQAYLRRTTADIEALMPLAPAIRLVKGAYNEPASVAFPNKREVDAAYLALASRLLEGAGPHGARPVFGTHDLRLLDRIRARAATLGTAPGAFEVHMLYGIRAAAQRALAGAGVKVRVLISYGRHWFPWYMRRLAERPANVWFVVRHFF